MWWLIGKFAAGAGVTGAIMLCSVALVVVCNAALAEREHKAKQVEANRAAANDRDNALRDCDAERRKRLKTEERVELLTAELLAARIELDALRRTAVFLPQKPADVRPADLIPPQTLPVSVLEGK